jgi:hypothetical protein
MSKKLVKPKHSLVGGSTCDRVLHCPGSIALVAKMPPKPSSSYADIGSLIHNILAEHLGKGIPLKSFLGTKFDTATFTQELLEKKALVALELLNEIDPNKELEFVVEAEIAFGDVIPEAYGSADLIGRIGKRAIVLDWKIGDGIVVTAEENPQLMFYTGAAMRTPGLEWVFDGIEEIECIIIQPPEIRRWLTTPERISRFEKELAMAVAESKKPNATIKMGKGCRWCAAKPTCPLMTGAVDRATQLALKDLNPEMIAIYLKKADVLEQWIADLRSLGHQMLEADVRVPGFKLVAKRAIRQWADDQEARNYFSKYEGGVVYEPRKLKSPTQMEKALKPFGYEVPKELVVAVSSGSTLVEESDPRPAVLNIGKQLTAALNKLN